MSDGNNAAFVGIDQEKTQSDILSQIAPSAKQATPVNKKLSESRLRLAAIQAFPTFVEAEVTLKEAISGTSRSFTVNDQTLCVHCLNLKPVSRLHCKECKGLGYMQVEREVQVDLPAGLLPDAEIRHSGLGAMDLRSGKNGDLVIKIKIIDNPHLKVEGKNVTSNLSVSLYQAVLGGEIEVRTATGRVVMDLKPLTQTGSIYRLKGLGIAGGDQLVTIEVNMPQMLTKEQVKLFQKIEELSCNSAQQKMALAH